jgi:hypothetical protein
VVGNCHFFGDEKQDRVLKFIFWLGFAQGDKMGGFEERQATADPCGMTNKRTGNGKSWLGDGVHPTHRGVRDGWGTRRCSRWGREQPFDCAQGQDDDETNGGVARQTKRAKEEVSGRFAGDLWLSGSGLLVDVAVEAGGEEDSLVAAGKCG